MKTKNFAIATTIILISVFSLTAQAVNKSLSANLDEVIKSTVKYPNEAKSKGITGFVLVELSISNDGSLMVDQINSDNDILKNYVISRLCNIKVSAGSISTKENRVYKFSFKLI